MVAIGVEDVVSEAVAQRLLLQYARGLEWTQTFGLTGYGELKHKMPTFDKIAQYREAMLVITDLDNPDLCLVRFREDWCRGLQMPPSFIFRIAVAEIESWLLADRDRIAQWLGISETRVPRTPETVVEPKECLVRLASRSRHRSIREAMVPVAGSTRSTGPGYNEYVSSFASDLWNPEAARSNSPSLDRAIIRIGELALRQQP